MTLRVPATSPTRKRTSEVKKISGTVFVRLGYAR
jgi:hypothetical protein